MSAPLLMSIRPRFAEAILEGEKTFELRRKPPGLEPGARIVIYASAPTCHVVGWFEVARVIIDSPHALWPRVRDRAGVSRAEFRRYFAGSKVAHAIEIRTAERVAPVALPIRPPQSWQYLHSGDRRHRALLAVTDMSA